MTRKKCSEGDSLVAGPERPDGYRPFVRHRADCEVISGIMRPVREGEPLNGNVFCVKQRGDTNIYDVEDVQIPSPTEGKGPAKVNSAAFRKGWDSIFGRAEVPEA